MTNVTVEMWIPEFSYSHSWQRDLEVLKHYYLLTKVHIRRSLKRPKYAQNWTDYERKAKPFARRTRRKGNDRFFGPSHAGNIFFAYALSCFIKVLIIFSSPARTIRNSNELQRYIRAPLKDWKLPLSSP